MVINHLATGVILQVVPLGHSPTLFKKFCEAIKHDKIIQNPPFRHHFDDSCTKNSGLLVKTREAQAVSAFQEKSTTIQKKIEKLTTQVGHLKSDFQPRILWLTKGGR